MANRLKKDAMVALSGFKAYFSQDLGRLGMIVSIQKYIASLRQSISELNTANDEIDCRLQAMGRHSAEKKAKAEQSTSELQTAQARMRQLAADASTLRRTVADLEKRMAPPDTSFPSEGKVGSLIKAIRIAFRVAPPFYGIPEVDDKNGLPFFKVDDFRQHDLGEGYVLIGKFVVLQTGIGHNVGFLAQTTKRLGSCGLPEKAQGEYITWFRSWVDYGKSVKRLEAGESEA